LRGCEPRPAWQNSFYLWIERNYLKTIDAFIFNSQTTHQVAQSLLGDHCTGVVAYPAGDRLASKITEHEIIARARQPGPLKLLFLGNVIPRKGLHILLDALKQVPRDKWILTVAGGLSLNKTYSRTIQRQVRTPYFEGMVHFLGPLNMDELKAQLRDSHLLVVPSFYEGYGIAYLEGMSFGLPAVGTTAGAAKEIITHGENGFLIDPGDCAALAQCLQQAAGNRGLLQKLSLAARQRYLAHPTWEDSTRRIREFLCTFVSDPRGFQN
jgi:glycosyltransferase involved in cell wall biosynthesis